MIINNYIDNHTDSQKSYKAIFSYIISKGKTTRREIQKFTNYSWSSVSSVVSVLINRKHVIETDSVRNGVGRGTSYIIPNGDMFVSIGVDINSVGFSLSVIGIDGSKKYFTTYNFSDSSKEGVLNLIYKCIEDGIAFIGDKYQLVSIGLSCQGSVDLTHSTLNKFSFCDEINNINLKEIIENKYNVHTYVEHDTNCLLEEYTYNYGIENGSICVARVVSGIGFAICVNGVPLEKFGGFDFGHMVVQPIEGKECSCGEMGCLEAYSSTVGIARQAKVDSFETIENNRENYREVLDEAGYYLGVTFANIMKIFNLDEVVVTGNVIGNDQKLLDKITATYNHFNKNNPNKVTYIDDLSPSFGAARLSFKDKVDSGKGL